MLVDNKPYGPVLNKKVKGLKFQLSVRKLKYAVSIVAVSEKRGCISDQSNVIEFITESFLPFYYYSFLNDLESIYTEALSTERSLPLSKAMKVNFLQWSFSLSSLTAVNIFTGKAKTIIPSRGPKHPTTLLFWSNLNSYSFKMLKWMTKYAENPKSQVRITTYFFNKQN